MDTITPEGLKSFNFSDIAKTHKVKSKVFGLYSYVFSRKMALGIDANDLDNQKDVILAAAVDFLKSLKDNTVYKCLFIGVTAEGDVKSSSEASRFALRASQGG